MPGGRVVSAATWQAWGLEFVPSLGQNFFFTINHSFTRYDIIGCLSLIFLHPLPQRIIISVCF